MATLPYPHGRQPVVIDAQFEEEAKAMAKAMQTGELPARDTPYYERVKALAEWHWQGKDVETRGRT